MADRRAAYRLTDEQRGRIRELLVLGLSVRAIVERLGLSERTICAIKAEMRSDRPNYVENCP